VTMALAWECGIGGVRGGLCLRTLPCQLPVGRAEAA
jgi:hypothetical protein